MCSATGSSTTTSTTSSSSATPTIYVIQPKPGVPFDTLTSFTNRLETENDPSTITVTEDPGDQFLAYWYLPLLPDQVQTYLQDPAVSAHLGTI
jgi:hypothetical protein